MKKTRIRGKIEAIVGEEGGGCWQQTVIREVGERVVGVVVSLKGEDKGSLGMRGEEWLEAIMEGIMGLEEFFLDEVKGVVRRVIVNGGEGDVLVVASEGEVVYLVGKGRVGAVLVRNGEAVRIFSEERELVGVSGEVRAGDMVVGGGEKLVRFIEEREVEFVLEEEKGVLLRRWVMEQGKECGWVGFWTEYVREKIEQKRSVDLEKVRLKIKRKKGWQENKKWGVGLVILTLMLSGWGMLLRRQKVREKKIRQSEEAIQQILGQVEPSLEAEKEFGKAYMLVDELKDVVGQDNEEVRRLQEQISKKEKAVLNKKEVKGEVFLETKVVGKVSKMVRGGEGRLLLGGERVVLVGVAKKDILEVGGGSEVINYDEIKKQVMWIKDGGVWAKGGEEEARKIVENDGEWGRISLVRSYAGNIYLLDQGKSEIWKYPVLDEGYGARRRWFGKGVVIDLSGVIDFEVDGDVWLLTKSGKLERYSRGVPVKWGERGSLISLKEPVGIEIQEERVYVLEKGEGRIVVFGRDDGKYKGQYQGDFLKKGEDLVILGKKGYVLGEGKIWTFDL